MPIPIWGHPKGYRESQNQQQNQNIQQQNQYNQNFQGSPFEYNNPGLTPFSNYQEQQRRFAAQLADPQSEYYQQFRSYLGSVTPQIGTNALLAPLMAGGGNQAASQAQASALRDEYAGERNEFLNAATSGFASQNLGLAAGVQGQAAQNEMNQRFTTQGQQLQWEGLQAQNADFGDWAAAIAPGIASFGLSMIPGGAALAPAAMAISDRRLKENIEKVGASPSGVNIYEFNYKGGDTRYRGAMADENPQASMEMNGIKYLDYSKIDVDFEVV